MARKPRIGRPPRAGRVADDRLELRITADERKRWTAAAGDTPVSRWAIDAINAAAKKSGH